jgi:hypothetical protein
MPYHDPDDDPLEVQGRVNQATLTEIESGDVELALECAPEVGSGDVSSELMYFVEPAAG